MRFSKYRKILVYAVTFLAYAWSGYGADLLGNIRDAVLSAESIFGDFFQNAVTVAKKFRDVHEVIDAAAEDSCIYRCPGGALPKPNWNHKPKSNGCGAMGLEQFQEFFTNDEIKICCDNHDICYDTCNSDKEKCDLDFKRCLYKYCDTLESTSINVMRACRAAAKLYFAGTTTFGCKSFLDSQKQACYCNEKWNSRYK
ncbi:group XIIA secretory phospholipase A2 [Athalia rosae]|uniref:group XIIA secretory phospholipase A2 n=1 Tax=Athalia rosae TaxID=37344 RepID=UPI0020333A56|nr:group XIIA secretory phospholipase A2 [Athalia rosae]XP_048510374.1 group XIIA secretory phospholipase A2 [Athalia rosae]